MELYHGSNMAVEKPMLLPSDRKLDFGPGFYLTSSHEQAESWAILKTTRSECGKATVSIFDIEETEMAKLNILSFPDVSVDWLRYVCCNRLKDNCNDNYDIVIGPVADDRTMATLRLFYRGVYSERETIEKLLPQKLKDQYAFKTEKAIHMLSLKNVMEVMLL